MGKRHWRGYREVLSIKHKTGNLKQLKKNIYIKLYIIKITNV